MPSIVSGSYFMSMQWYSHDALLHKVSKLENMVAVLQTVGCTVHAPLKERLTELELLANMMSIHFVKL